MKEENKGKICFKCAGASASESGPAADTLEEGERLTRDLVCVCGPGSLFWPGQKEKWSRCPGAESRYW